MKEVYFTAVYKGITPGMSAQVIGMDERVCAMSWSHAIDEKNSAQDKVKELTKQRDELLKVLMVVNESIYLQDDGALSITDEARLILKNAIANAEK